MGDAADRYTENGIDELAAHQNGDCEFRCPYCEAAQTRKAEAVKRAAKKRTKRAGP